MKATADVPKIRVAIAGYGNIGKGVESAIGQNDDMELVAILTRRDPESVRPKTHMVKVYDMADAASLKNKVDVLLLCGGSATDLPVQGPMMAALFNTVDSFDTHARIPEYFDTMDKAAKTGGHISIISVGWDPGMFSINRVYGDALLPDGRGYTFWGKGVSQGHSDALRRVKGVKNAIQYTVPIESAVQSVRDGKYPEFTLRQMSKRVCYIVPEEGANLSIIEKTVKEMPNYFVDYDTTINFITEDEMKRDHNGMSHGGFVIRSGRTDGENGHVIEYSLKLGSNPEFTGSTMVAYARAAHRMRTSGQTGAKTVLDIAPSMISIKTPAELRKQML